MYIFLSVFSVYHDTGDDKRPGKHLHNRICLPGLSDLYNSSGHIHPIFFLPLSEFHIALDADLSVWFEHIVDGTSDFRIDDKPIFDTYKKDFGFKLQGTPLPEDVSKQIFTADLSAYYLFPMTDQGAALRDEIDQVLVKLQEDGALKKLSEQFFGADHSPDASKMERTVN